MPNHITIFEAKHVQIPHRTQKAEASEYQFSVDR